MKNLLIALSLFSMLALSSFAQDKPNTEKIKVEEDQTFLILSTKRIQTLEKELDEVASKGFRVMYAAPTQQFDLAILLERLENPEQENFSYKILATSRLKTMEKELNENAAAGFQLLPRSIVFKAGLFTAELVMLMERSSKTKKYVYKLIEAFKEIKLHKKIEEAMADGYQPVTMITLGNHVIVMEKEIK